MNVLYKDSDIEVRKVVVGPYVNNCYIVIDPKTNDSIIVDAPTEPETILKEAHGTNVKAVLITHTHFDHIGCFKELKQSLRVPMVVHPNDEPQLPEKADQHFQHNGTFSFGNITFKTIHVPGHTPGGTSFLYKDHLFSGDTLFPGGPGRTTSSENFQQLVKNLEGRIFVLEDHVNVYPGHGDETVLGKEKKQYAQFKQRKHPPDLHGDVEWLKS